MAATEMRDLTVVHPRYALDEQFYDNVRSAKRILLDSFVIPPSSDRGFIVEKGQAFRVKQEAGAQVGELAFWTAHDPNDRFAAMRNRLLEGL